MAGYNHRAKRPELEPANVVVPADPSSAAFPMVAALLVPGSDLILDAVMMVSADMEEEVYTTKRNTQKKTLPKQGFDLLLLEA